MGEVPAKPTQVDIASAWVEAERLLYLCASRHDRLVDFEMDRVPVVPKMPPVP